MSLSPDDLTPLRVNDSADVRPESPREVKRRRMVWISGLLLAAALLAGVVFPVSYVAEHPGPTVNTIGDVDLGEGEEPVLSIEGTETYPVDGALDMTTVSVQGPPTGATFAIDVLFGWMFPHVSLTPSATVYPSNVSSSEVQETNTVAMNTSQSWAMAAALEYLEIDYTQHLFVHDFAEGAEATDLLRRGDQVIAANGHPITGLQGLKDAVDDSAPEPVTLTIERDGEQHKSDVPVTEAEDGSYQIGIYLDSEFDFPYDFEVSLGDVGGASAGMMFALGIIEKLTEENLVDGDHIAGTGTIDPDGTVGPIGGILQKVYGAQRSGATVFLAPEANCPELDDKVPDGITVYSVSSLEQAVEIVKSHDTPEAENVTTCG